MASWSSQGIDVSAHSGQVEWAKVIGEGYGFAFVKATEGVDFKDSAFDGNWQAMKAAGMIRGAYHFYVTEDDPTEQANFFISNVTLEPGDLAPVVDVEVIGHNTPQGGLPQRLATWLSVVEQHYGVKPIIYTSPNFWNTYFDDSFGAYPLWVAEYGVGAPKVTTGWKTWSLWQWQGDATVVGVQNSADLNRVNPEIDPTALLVSR